MYNERHNTQTLHTQTHTRAMNYPFDNAQPLTTTQQQQQQTSQHQPSTTPPNEHGTPQCVIHSNQINHEGNVLVQVHTYQPNGQPQTQSYYVSKSDMPAFVQHHQQQHPTMHFTEQQSPQQHPPSTQQQQHPTTQQRQPSTQPTPFAPYDKYGSSFSSCEDAYGQPMAPPPHNLDDPNNC